MRVAYFTSHVFEDDFLSSPVHGKRPNPAGQNFHGKVIRALARFAEVDVYSYLPLPLQIPEKDFQADKNIRYHYVQTSTNKWIRAMFGPAKLAGRAKKTMPDAIFFDSLNRSAVKAAIDFGMRIHRPTIAILTDHPGNITGLKPSYSKTLLSLNAKADACFSLTPKLVEAFGFSNKPHLIQPVLIEARTITPYASKRPYIYYGGALFVKDGLSDLLEAFTATNPNYDLVVAGHGPYENEIVEAAKKNRRILFKGQVSQAEHLSLVAGSVLAINPRRYNKAIDDYAVPSKVMEYLCYAPCVASTKSSPLQQSFPEDINWIDGELLPFFKKHLNADRNLEGLTKNTASNRVVSEFGLEKTGLVLQEFLAKVSV